MRLTPVLALLIACQSAPGKLDTRPLGDSADTSGPFEGPPDSDGDGVDAGSDCDDADPTVHPGAVEVCDGADQDCDGVADEDVITDGAGCADPGPPVADEWISVLQVTIATADTSYADTDDELSVCVGEGWCFEADIADWNDRENGNLDVQIYDSLALPRAELDRFELHTNDGSDRWEPAGFMVTADGEPVYARCDPGFYVGSGGSSEVTDWTDPDGLGLHCPSVWPSPITHGPMTGATGATDAWIWYRTDATRQVQLRVVPAGGDLSSAPVVHYGYPSPDADLTDHVHVQNLSPDQDYAFDLEIDGVRLGPWSFHTAPPEGQPGMYRIAFSSCTEEDDEPAFGAVLDQEPDIYAFIGDNHYGNTSDLTALRQWYRWAHSRPLRSDLLHETSTLAIWDDHDYVGNNLDGTAAGKDNAVQAFGEYWANSAVGTSDIVGIFHRERYGDVDLFLIDDRYWRGLDDSITGDAQEAWLIDAVTSSTATFKLVFSGSQWTAYGSSDSWAHFPEARSRVLDAFTTVPGVVVLSGDVHRAEFRLMDDPAGYAVPELTASSMAEANSICFDTPDLLSCFASGRYFVTMDIDTTLSDATLTATIYDADGVAQDSWLIRRSELGG